MSNAQDRPWLPFFEEKGPYYTSYPTLALWSTEMKSEAYQNALLDFFRGEGKAEPVHLYIHIPFCAKLCWYCICNIRVSNNRERIQKFVDQLCRETDKLREFFEEHSIQPRITELQLGGGTPSHLDRGQWTQLVEAINKLVDVNQVDEFAMEIDPRTATSEDLDFYASRGVTRISFGVQDFDPGVQKAINRIQPPELIRELLPDRVRGLFQGLNFDLLYGLPRQTRATFRRTLELVKEFAPDRVTLLKYAHVPNIRKHMKLINEEELTPESDLPDLFEDAVLGLTGAGYEWVGIDNFARHPDPLAKAVRNGTVGRTFNGFTPGRTQHMIGLGPTTTTSFGKYYFQGVYDNNEYYECLDRGDFPIHRGYALSVDETIRRAAIMQLITNQTLDFKWLSEKYDIDAHDYFAAEIQELKNRFTAAGMVEFKEDGELRVTAQGRYGLRTIAKVFDRFHFGREYEIGGC